MDAEDLKVPNSAAWLGGLGAVPFIGLAGAMPFIAGDSHRLLAQALVAYGATILSFLGGIHWGLAIGSKNGIDHGKLPARLILSVLPSLAAWAALLIPDRSGLIILATAIAAMLWVDIRASQIGQAPLWYPKLRIPLSSVVILTLYLAAIA